MVIVVVLFIVLVVRVRPKCPKCRQVGTKDDPLVEFDNEKRSGTGFVRQGHYTPDLPRRTPDLEVAVRELEVRTHIFGTIPAYVRL